MTVAGLGLFAATVFTVLALTPSDDRPFVATTGDEDQASTTAVDESAAAPDSTHLTLPGGAPVSEDQQADTDAAGASSVEAAAPDEGATGGTGGPGPGGEIFEGLRNDQAKFSQFAGLRSDQLDLGALTEAAPRPDNGTVGDGQFRLACEYSHFSYDDPIVFPGEPGRAHLHMFYGNTETDAFSTDDSILNTGGGTCNGYELNRSAYWSPALLDGNGNVIVPDSIILYYKSKDTGAVQALPQGLKMVAGNTNAETFTASHLLHWSCGGNGGAYNYSNRIPDCGGAVINASVVFPNCWDGVNLDSPDHLSHLTYVAEENKCPADYPVRLPQISILLYFPGSDSVEGWHLSSDLTSGFNSGPGATLHADWWGGWNDEALELWTDGCMRAARNCSFGQTGTSRQLAALNGLQVYEGPNLLPLPDGSYPPSG